MIIFYLSGYYLRTGALLTPWLSGWKTAVKITLLAVNQYRLPSNAHIYHRLCCAVLDHMGAHTFSIVLLPLITNDKCQMYLFKTVIVLALSPSHTIYVTIQYNIDKSEAIFTYLITDTSIVCNQIYSFTWDMAHTV